MLKEGQVNKIKLSAKDAGLSQGELSKLAFAIKPIDSLADIRDWDNAEMDKLLDAISLASGGKVPPSQPMPKKGDEFRTKEEMKVWEVGKMATDAAVQEMLCGKENEFSLKRWRELVDKMYVYLDRKAHVQGDEGDGE